MANRDTLHLKHLEPFTLWLMEQGYTRQPTTNFYEALRMRKGKDTIVLYRRNNMEQHFSVRDKDMRLVRAFLRYYKGGDAHANHHSDDQASVPQRNPQREKDC